MYKKNLLASPRRRLLLLSQATDGVTSMRCKPPTSSRVQVEHLLVDDLGSP